MQTIHAIFNHPGLRSFLVKLRVPLMLLLAVAIVRYVDHRWLWPGFVVSMMGEFIQLWCFASLDKNSTLAARGPYSVVRNPMYLGRFFILFGILMLLGIWWLLVIFAVGYWFYMVNRVGREEARLRQLFGAPYEDYCEAVHRFVPGPVYQGPLAFWNWSLFRQNHGAVNLIGTLAFWVAAIGWVLTR